MNTMYDNSVTVAPIAADCGHKLPCGVCRLMMCMCPISGTPVVTQTWTVCTGTGTGKDVELTSKTKAAYKEGEQK